MKNPILILGTGRCGSTLIQRILNTSENITIWGEHAGFISDLARSYYTITNSEAIEQNFYSKNIDSSILVGELTNYQACPNWINSFNKASIRLAYRNVLINTLCQEVDINQSHWGFKEIRYTKNDPAIDMWLELFPDSSIILSVRNPFDVIKSMIIDWNNLTVLKKLIEDQKYSQIEELVIKFARRWNNIMESYEYWIETKKINCYVEKYEELLIAPAEKINQMFDFLNVPISTNAVKPMSFKVGSKKHNNLSEISNIIYSLRDDIWQIVQKSATYFDYNITSVDKFKP